MLTSRKLIGNAETISAYHTKEENYYFSQAEGLEWLGEASPGQSHVRIYGKLARHLGFSEGQTIDERALTNLLLGRNAAGESVTRAHKVHGVDLTFSAPKSVSIAGLLSIRDPKIVQAHDAAVLETMSEIEQHCAGAHPRADQFVHTGNLAYVTVRDGFNRDHDPHLHTHVVVMNMTRLGDKILAVDGKRIMARDFNKLWGAMYRSKLAAKLKELDYSVSYTKKGELRLDNVSIELEREFSGRRAQIEKAKDKGVRDMEAWRTTRKEKDPEAEKANIVAGWRRRAAKYQEKSAADNRAEAVALREAWYKEARWSVEAWQERAGERTTTEAGRWQAAARRATDREARVSAHAIITEYLAELGREETWEPVSYAEAEHRLQVQVRAGNIVATDNGRFTTWELTRADRECLASHSKESALAVSEPAARSAVASFVQTSVSMGRRPLSAVQQEAAARILAAESALVVVQGDAGSGKTSMLKAVRSAAAEAGWGITGVALQGIAARKLEAESGIASLTLAAYLGRERANPGETGVSRRSRLLVVDEASMLSSRSLAELVRCCEAGGDKLVLVGDRNQLQSVGAGKPFERLVEAAEKAGELISLNENYRQRNSTLRKAVDLARTARMRESLDVLDRAGKLDEIEDAHLRRQTIAKEYEAGTLILTGSREARGHLNDLIRERLLERGEIDKRTAQQYRLAWRDEDGIRHKVSRELAVGDRVTFLENEYQVYDLRNGDIGMVTKTAPSSLEVQLEDGRRVALDLGRYSATDYGYAVTTYKSQGQTYDKVIVEADTQAAGLQDQRNCYVQITRARDEVKIYTDNREALRDMAGVLSVKADTLDLDASLSQAVAMEQSVRKKAFEHDLQPSKEQDFSMDLERGQSRQRSSRGLSRD